MSDTMHASTESGELIPVLSAILKIEADSIALLGDVQTKARQTVDDAQQRTREVASDGQTAAKKLAVIEVKKIQDTSYEQAEALEKEGSFVANELRERLERNLGNAVDLVIDRVIEGDSCLTETGALTC